jgi:hypothetical protein
MLSYFVTIFRVLLVIIEKIKEKRLKMMNNDGRRLKMIKIDLNASINSNSNKNGYAHIFNNLLGTSYIENSATTYLSPNLSSTDSRRFIE